MKKTHSLTAYFMPHDDAYLQQNAMALIDLWNWMCDLQEQPTEDNKKFNHRYIVNRLNRTLMITHPQLSNMHKDLINQRIKDFIKALDLYQQKKVASPECSLRQTPENGMYIRYSTTTAALIGVGKSALRLDKLPPINIEEIMEDGVIKEHGFFSVVLKYKAPGQWQLIVVCVFEPRIKLITEVQTSTGDLVPVSAELLQHQHQVHEKYVELLRKQKGSFNYHNTHAEYWRMRKELNQALDAFMMTVNQSEQPV